MSVGGASGASGGGGSSGASGASGSSGPDRSSDAGRSEDSKDAGAAGGADGPSADASPDADAAGRAGVADAPSGVDSPEETAARERAQEVTGASASPARAPEVNTGAPTTAVSPSRGLSDPDPAAVDPATADAAADPAAADAAAADPAATDPAAAPDPAALATEVTELSTTDPAAAAERMSEVIAASEDATFRESFVEGTRPAQETIGASIVDPNNADTQRTVDALAAASDALHASGQADTAATLADGVAEGVVAADAAQTGPYSTDNSHLNGLGSSLSNAITEGRGAELAADLSINFGERAAAAHAGATNPHISTPEAERAATLGATTAGALREGTEALGATFDEAHAGMRNEADRFERAEGRFGEHLSGEARATAAEAMGERVGALREEKEIAAERLVGATDASARAAHALSGLNMPPGAGLQAQVDAAHATRAGLDRFEGVAATGRGSAALADEVTRGLDGERTLFDDVRDLRDNTIAIGRGDAENAFAGAAVGAAIIGSKSLAEGGGLDRAATALEANADLLGRGGEAAIREVATELRSGDVDLDRLDSVLGNGRRVGGSTAATLLGGLGALTKPPSALDGRPGLQRFGQAAGLLAGLGQLYANGGPGETFAEKADFYSGLAGAGADAVELGAGFFGGDVAGNVGRWAGYAGRAFGSAGAALKIGGALADGDAYGVASGSLALAGAMAGNPYLAAAGGLMDLGRVGYDAVVDHHDQVDYATQYLNDAGLSPDNAEFVSGWGNYGLAAISPYGERTSGISDLNARIDAMRADPSLAFDAQAQWQVEQRARANGWN